MIPSIIMYYTVQKKNVQQGIYCAYFADQQYEKMKKMTTMNNEIPNMQNNEHQHEPKK